MRTDNKRNAYIIPVLAIATVCTVGTHCGGTRSKGLSFATPEQAANALVASAKNNDVEKLVQILGPPARDIVVTDDQVADRNMRQRFVDRATEKTQVVPDPGQGDKRLLVVGNDDWPFPIPLVQSHSKWHFDSAEGYDEILRRRIGNNELIAIEVCRGYVEAQYDYAKMSQKGAEGPQYAQKVISTPGTRDGLFWKSDDPNDQSPMAEIIAKAAAEGYTDKAEPYQGYYFKILTGQGSLAPGGAASYLENGVLKNGFALIAWPSDYESTGLMTFQVNQTGIVYQKDLGKKTAAIAGAATVYDPDGTWTPVPASNIP